MNRAVLFALLAAAPLTGCVVRSRTAGYVEDSYPPAADPYAGDVYVSNPPPPPVTDYRSSPRGLGSLGVDGYGDWPGYDWAWTNGYWAPPRAGYVYVRPSYEMVGGRWQYRRGYWGDHDGHRDYQYARPS